MGFPVSISRIHTAYIGEDSSILGNYLKCLVKGHVRRILPDIEADSNFSVVLRSRLEQFSILNGSEDSEIDGNFLCRTILAPIFLVLLTPKCYIFTPRNVNSNGKLSIFHGEIARISCSICPKMVVEHALSNLIPKNTEKCVFC